MKIKTPPHLDFQLQTSLLRLSLEITAAKPQSTTSPGFMRPIKNYANIFIMLIRGRIGTKRLHQLVTLL
jgi:hypothetical protein